MPPDDPATPGDDVTADELDELGRIVDRDVLRGPGYTRVFSETLHAIITRLRALTADRDAHRAAAREAEAERDALRRTVGAYHNLLARIFRDGGQRQDAIGDDARAGEVAEGIVVGYVAALEAAVGERDALRGAVEAMNKIFDNHPAGYGLRRMWEAFMGAVAEQEGGKK